MKTKRLLGIIASMALASISITSVNAQIINGNMPNEWAGMVTMQEKVDLYQLVPEGFQITDASYLAIKLTEFDKGQCDGIFFYNPQNNGGWDDNGGANYEWGYGGGKLVNVEEDGMCYIPVPKEKFTDAGEWAEIWFQHWGGPDIQIDEAGMKLVDANKVPLGETAQQAPAETQATEAQQQQAPAATQQTQQAAKKQNAVAAKAANPSTGQKENAAALILTAAAAAATVGATYKKRK